MANITKTMDLLTFINKVFMLANSSQNIQITIQDPNNLLQSSNTTRTDTDMDNGAVLYIVAVLVFYSAGIVIMLIKYSKSERKQMEEEAALDIFYKGMPFGKSMKEHNVNSVAIRAFHTLTVASYENRKNEIIPKNVMESDV